MKSIKRTGAKRSSIFYFAFALVFAPMFGCASIAVTDDALVERTNKGEVAKNPLLR